MACFLLHRHRAVGLLPRESGSASCRHGDRSGLPVFHFAQLPCGHHRTCDRRGLLRSDVFARLLNQRALNCNRDKYNKKIFRQGKRRTVLPELGSYYRMHKRRNHDYRCIDLQFDPERRKYSQHANHHVCVVWRCVSRLLPVGLSDQAGALRRNTGSLSGGNAAEPLLRIQHTRLVA